MCSTENVYLKDGGTVGFMKPYKNGRFAFAALLRMKIRALTIMSRP